MSQFEGVMQAVRRIKIGIGIQGLVDEAYKILGNPILMFNTEYTLLAHADAKTDDPMWNEIVACGTFSRETQKVFDNEGFIEEIVNSARIALLKSQRLKYDRIVGKVFNKNNTYVANLVITACNRPFDENDLMVFEAICKQMTREVSKSGFYQEYEQTHQETIIRNLIDGNYDVKLDMAQVGILYDSLKSNLYVAVTDISRADHACGNAVHFRDMFREIEPMYKYAVYSDYVIMIISTNDEKLKVCRDLKKFTKAFDENNLYVGVSDRFENLFELKKYFMEALKAMEYVAEIKSIQRIFPCDQRSMDKMEQIRGLVNGEGIQYFLDIGPGIFGNPLLFHDMELNLLAYSKNEEIVDPIWEELITYGTSSDETIDLFRTEGFINTMENTKGGALLVSDKIKYDRISWRIYSNDNIMIGCLSIVNTMIPFTDDELVLFGAFSRKFSKEVEKIEFYNNYGRVYSETVINKFISGDIDNNPFYSEDIGNLYANLMDNLQLVVVDTSKCDSERVNLTYIRDLFNRSDAVNRYSIYEGYIIIIISMGSMEQGANDEFGEIGKVFEQNDIYAGVSSCFSNIYDLQKHYAEAVSALTEGLKKQGRCGGQRVFLYDGGRH